MIYPSLVRASVCKTPVSVTLYEDEIDENGAPVVACTLELMCNWQDGARVIYTKEQKRIEVNGRALFNGDICPQLSGISGGFVDILGSRRSIARGRKHRNPDGTVNYTELDVI